MMIRENREHAALKEMQLRRDAKKQKEMIFLAQQEKDEMKKVRKQKMETYLTEQLRKQNQDRVTDQFSLQDLQGVMADEQSEIHQFFTGTEYKFQEWMSAIDRLVRKEDETVYAPEKDILRYKITLIANGRVFTNETCEELKEMLKLIKDIEKRLVDNSSDNGGCLGRYNEAYKEEWVKQERKTFNVSRLRKLRQTLVDTGCCSTDCNGKKFTFNLCFGFWFFLFLYCIYYFFNFRKYFQGLGP